MCKILPSRIKIEWQNDELSRSGTRDFKILLDGTILRPDSLESLLYYVNQLRLLYKARPYDKHYLFFRFAQIFMYLRL